jgi:WhiB family redox-sensing transcriptional regulator
MGDLDETFGQLAGVARPWASDALCREHPEVDYFARDAESQARAKAVCACCLVRRECLDYALDQRIEEGVWGGTSAPQRRYARQMGLRAGDLLPGSAADAWGDRATTSPGDEPAGDVPVPGSYLVEHPFSTN